MLKEITGAFDGIRSHDRQHPPIMSQTYYLLRHAAPEMLDSVTLNQYFQLMPIYILHNTNIQQQYTYTQTNAASHLCKHVLCKL